MFSIEVDAEPGGHRFRFVVDGESRTSPEYKQAVDHQNVVVNYLDHAKHELEVSSYESYHSAPGISIPTSYLYKSMFHRHKTFGQGKFPHIFIFGLMRLRLLRLHIPRSIVICHAKYLQASHHLSPLLS